MSSSATPANTASSASSFRAPSDAAAIRNIAAKLHPESPGAIGEIVPQLAVGFRDVQMVEELDDRPRRAPRRAHPRRE